MIAICADLHGNQYRLADIMQQVRWRSPHEDNYIICCGDWGFLMRNNYAEQCFLDDLEMQKITWLFLEGNHDNYSVLNQYPVSKWMGGQVHFLRKNVIHLMRGECFDIAGQRFFVFGGAATPEADRQRRALIEKGTGIKSWWAEEVPDSGEMARGWETLRTVGFEVDYILTHTGPKTIISYMGFDILAEEVKFANYLDRLRDSVSFKRWFFGHFHRDWQFDRFVCLWSNTTFL